MDNLLLRHTRQCAGPLGRRGATQGQQQLLASVPRRRHLALQSGNGASVPERVPASELPKPHPKAMQALAKLKGADAGGQQFKALTDRLGSVPFTLVGDDDALNWSATQQLAKRLGYFPVSTLRVLAGMHKLDPKTACAQDVLGAVGSEQKLAEAEAQVLRGLSKEKRAVVCTLAEGATGHAATYKDLWGSFILRIDVDSPSAPKPPTAARALMAANAEVSVGLKPPKAKGFSGAGAVDTEQQAKAAVEILVIKMVEHLNSNSGIVDKKRAYVHYGCRGDWPDVQPAGWSPALESFGRLAVVDEAPASPAPDAGSATVDVSSQPAA